MEPENSRIDFLSRTMCHDETSSSRRYRACGMLYSRYINVARHNRDIRAKRSLEFSTSVYDFLVDLRGGCTLTRIPFSLDLVQSIVSWSVDSNRAVRFTLALFVPLLFFYVPVSLRAAPARSTRLNRVPVSR